jgi:peptide/nickel transport system substrate-binding protein
LAQGWTLAPDGLSVDIALRSGIEFHDGSPVTAAAVVKTLASELPQFMGPAFQDIEEIKVGHDGGVRISFKRASPFLLEALEVPIRKLDGSNAGTGPFIPSSSVSELHANPGYYLGKPSIDRVVVTDYPSIRAAWADLLRERVDMLYEVSVDALESLAGAKSISVFSFTRPYQYVIVLNLESPQLRSPAIRRALNLALDREALVREGLGGRGFPSRGPISPQHWAIRDALPTLEFAPEAAARAVASVQGNTDGFPIRFTCLIPSQYERLGLLVKRQLEQIGVEMDIEEASPTRIIEAMNASSFEAAFLDVVSGPSLFRLYQWWHSSGALNFGHLGSRPTDAALDRIRQASSDDDYRRAVAAFQNIMVDDPPAIFLAWSERARAVSSRFAVPVEPGRDILTTLRLWRPVNDPQLVNRN